MGFIGAVLQTVGFHMCTEFLPWQNLIKFNNHLFRQTQHKIMIFEPVLCIYLVLLFRAEYPPLSLLLCSYAKISADYYKLWSCHFSVVSPFFIQTFSRQFNLKYLHYNTFFSQTAHTWIEGQILNSQKMNLHNVGFHNLRTYAVSDYITGIRHRTLVSRLQLWYKILAATILKMIARWKHLWHNGWRHSTRNSNSRK
jgi:hypothetical protein